MAYAERWNGDATCAPLEGLVTVTLANAGIANARIAGSAVRTTFFIPTILKFGILPAACAGFAVEVCVIS